MQIENPGEAGKGPHLDMLGKAFLQRWCKSGEQRPIHRVGGGAHSIPSWLEGPGIKNVCEDVRHIRPIVFMKHLLAFYV